MPTPNLERGVAVAQDVIKQLDAEHPYVASTTGYIYSPALTEDLKGDLQDHVDKIQEAGCRVCAVGASLVSMARLYDQVPVEVFFQGRGGERQAAFRNLLGHIFPPETVALMECAFEQSTDFCWWFYDYQWKTTNAANRVRWAERFGLGYENSKERLRAIMQNIVDNGGIFGPKEDLDA